jgi:polyhydroxybutyrate depolymerase
LYLFVLLLVVTGLAACTATEAASTATIEELVAPTETVVIPPTETPVPPTETSIPPTETPVPTATSEFAIAPEDSEHVVMVGEVERSYLLFIPPGLTTEQAVPVMFAFTWGTPSEMKTTTGFYRIAEKYGFIVVYPATLRGSWNNGTSGMKDVDDYGFIEAILSELGSTVNIDPKRIYAVGASNGGEFVYRLACDMSDTFAAIAPVGSSMTFDNPCEPTRAVSIIHIHGLADETHPFEGGGFMNFTPAEDGIETWVALNSCTDSVIQEGEGRGVMETIYSSCQDGAIVELITIDNLGHEWRAQSTETIWMFFAAHPMP